MEIEATIVEFGHAFGTKFGTVSEGLHDGDVMSAKWGECGGKRECDRGLGSSKKFASR